MWQAFATDAAVDDESEVEHPEADDDGRQSGDEAEDIADDETEPMTGPGELFEHLGHGGQQEHSGAGEHDGEEQIQPQPGTKPTARAEPVFQPR